MAIDIKAPQFPESVADGTVATWHKKPGESVSRDELLVDIETDKVVLEVVAPADGVIRTVLKQEGDTVLSEEVLAQFEEGASGAGSASRSSGQDAGAASADGKRVQVEAATSKDGASSFPDGNDDGESVISPAARKLIQDKGLDASKIKGTGKGRLITKEDVMNFLETGGSASTPAKASGSAAGGGKSSGSGERPATRSTAPAVDLPDGDRPEKRVPMTRLRASIARRLVEAQQTAAMLTTFNEVNMQPIMSLRNQYKEAFQKRHDGVKLGFMSFFVRAACEALKRFPAVNASIDGNDMVYHGYQDIGVAVSSDRGLVVPVLRDADQMSLAAIESGIAEYGRKARDGKLAIEDMTGGTFTISNGGIFGSLMSTPILNPPQTAIMGMHKIQERPMAVNGKVEILPMMYLALSYDHRMIDGKEAVQFLVTIKDLLEDPARILLEI